LEKNEVRSRQCLKRRTQKRLKQRKRGKEARNKKEEIPHGDETRRFCFCLRLKKGERDVHAKREEDKNANLGNKESCFDYEKV
jgi:hypothetical protein